MPLVLLVFLVSLCSLSGHSLTQANTGKAVTSRNHRIPGTIGFGIRLALQAGMMNVIDSPKILIADDQPHVLDALRLLLKSDGFVPETVSSPAAVMQAVQDSNF